MKTRTFDTHYLTQSGVLMILGDNYFILVRVSDGLCRRFELLNLFLTRPPRPDNLHLSDAE